MKPRNPEFSKPQEHLRDDTLLLCFEAFEIANMTELIPIKSRLVLFDRYGFSIYKDCFDLGDEVTMVFRDSDCFEALRFTISRQKSIFKTRDAYDNLSILATFSEPPSPEIMHLLHSDHDLDTDAALSALSTPEQVKKAQETVRKTEHAVRHYLLST